MKTTIQTLTTTSALALFIAGSAMAQLAPQTSPTAPPAASGAAGKADPVLEAKWKALDKDGKGVIEGAALESFKPVMPLVDTDKDGKISKEEFMTAAKAGIIK